MEIAVYPCSVPAKHVQGFDVTVFGKYAGRVRYGEDEKNKDSLLYRLCSVSQQAGTVLALADTVGGGAPRRSVLVADGGKLLGITDELSALQQLPRSGKTMRVYATAAGNIGVLVGADLYAYEPAHILSACGAELIVHLSAVRKRQADLVGGALAYLCGVPLLSVASGVAALYGETGELLYASPINGGKITFTPKKEKPV